MSDRPRPGDLPRPAEKGCPAALTPCGELCVDLKTDPVNCGKCAFACAPELDCLGGVCACKAGSRCKGECCNATTCCTGGKCCSGACCKGCCSTTYGCLQGTAQGSCGAGGNACVSCTTECHTGACVQGACVFDPYPDGTSCSGGTGKCWSGVCCTAGCWDGAYCRNSIQLDAAHCGWGGAACASCGPAVDPCQPWDCMTGACQLLSWSDGTVCKPTTGGSGTCKGGKCCTGCWLGTVCVPPANQSSQQCGAGGVPCMACPVSCANGVCL